MWFCFFVLFCLFVGTGLYLAKLQIKKISDCHEISPILNEAISNDGYSLENTQIQKVNAVFKSKGLPSINGDFSDYIQ